MDQNKENAGGIMSYAVETQGEETKDFVQSIREKYPKEYAEEYAAFKEWRKEFMAMFEECRRRGVFLDDGSDGGDGRARYGLLGWLISMVSRTHL